MDLIQDVVDLSLQAGWDTITDLELAHRFIAKKGLKLDFMAFLQEMKAIDDAQE